ncbi:hypothetical protein GN956_G15147 [Arapaima gigas]
MSSNTRLDATAEARVAGLKDLADVRATNHKTPKRHDPSLHHLHHRGSKSYRGESGSAWGRGALPLPGHFLVTHAARTRPEPTPGKITNADGPGTRRRCGERENAAWLADRIIRETCFCSRTASLLRLRRVTTPRGPAAGLHAGPLKANPKDYGLPPMITKPDITCSIHHARALCAAAVMRQTKARPFQSAAREPGEQQRPSQGHPGAAGLATRRLLVYAPGGLLSQYPWANYYLKLLNVQPVQVQP